jgi:predicted MFS family arabinose efflux permease
LSFCSPYRAVLRTPHACAAFVTSLAGRLCYGIVFLSLTLTLTAGGHGYRLAGLVLALMGLAVVLVSPLRARMVDRHGPRRALPPMAAGLAAALAAIAAIPPRSGAEDAAIAALAVTAGACAPPFGVVMRALWSTLIDEPDLLQAAYSLDGVVEELLYVAGPVIAGVIAVVTVPAVGLLATAGLAVAGTGLFAWSPALRRWPAPVARPASAAQGTATGQPGASREIAQLSLVTGAIGLCLGGLPLVIVAFSQARHDPAALAWIEAALSAGSALGGLGYGAVTWRVSARRRLILLATGLALILAPAALSPSLPVLALLIGLAGVLVSPALATAYLITARLASPQARTRAGNWVNTGYNAGSSAGEALSGQLIGRIPLAACLPVLAAPALLAVMPLLLSRVTAARLAGQRPAGQPSAGQDPTAEQCEAAGARRSCICTTPELLQKGRIAHSGTMQD